MGEVLRRFLLFLIILILIGAGAYTYWQKYEAPKRTDHLTLFGNVDVRQVDLGFRVSGLISELKFQEGDLVKPGALVATLDKQPYQDQVLQARATVESARMLLINAEENLKRRKELINTGSVSKEDFDNALYTRNSLTANLKQAEAALGVAINNLNFTECFAPNQGIILTRVREPGSVVREGDTVYTLSLTNPIWIRAYVSEPNLGLIYPNMPADIYTDTPNGKVYHGKIGFISPISEFTPKTVQTTELRTDLVYRLRIYAENPDEGLRQGQPVTVKLKITNPSSSGQK